MTNLLGAFLLTMTAIYAAIAFFGTALTLAAAAMWILGA